MSEKITELTERLRKPFTGPMSGQEMAFLRDIQGAIEFAIRNGLTFPMIASAVGSDLNEVVRDGFDLDKAKARGFQPKVTGYAALTEDDFGETETPSSDS